MIDGFQLKRGYFSPALQQKLINLVDVATQTPTPWFRPTMPRTGTPMSVMMGNFGPLGWVADKSGYRYQPTHPETQADWPQMPDELLDCWHDLTACKTPPDCCLINWYTATSKMGLHVDKDEADYSYPVVSVSLGDDAVFKIGNQTRRGPYDRMILKSGDVVVMAGDARTAYHGVDRINAGSSALIPGGGRWNLTMRRAMPAD